MAFVDGKADPWGMKVNPAVPEDLRSRARVAVARPLRPQDRRAPVGRQQPAVLLHPARRPGPDPAQDRRGACWTGGPTSQTRCDVGHLVRPAFEVGRVDRQSYGARFMLGVVSLGDAARYGLRTASLRDQGRLVRRAVRPVAGRGREGSPSRRRGTAPSRPGSPICVARPGLPGTMIVSAARLRNASQDDADKVAQFIRVATTEGQRPGSGGGRAPRRASCRSRARASRPTCSRRPSRSPTRSRSSDRPRRRRSRHRRRRPPPPGAPGPGPPRCGGAERSGAQRGAVGGAHDRYLGGPVATDPTASIGLAPASGVIAHAAAHRAARHRDRQRTAVRPQAPRRR